MPDADSRGPHKPTTWQQSFRDAEPYLGLGMQLALTMVVFAAAGYGLDRLLGTSPWLLVAGAVLGMVAVFVLLIRVAKEADKGRRKP